MTDSNTITLCSLAELNLTRYTIENAIGWTAHMEYDQIIKCQDDGKPVLNIKQRQEEFIRRIKESGLHFRVKRIFHVIHPNLSWHHERKFTDSAMRYLKLFVKNDIPFTLLPSEGMTEDLERLQQNSPPLYNVVIGRLEAKENNSAGTLLDYRTPENLQQKQPKPSEYDKGLLEVKRMVDKLYDEANIGLSEYDSGLYNGITETCMKLRGFIKARLDSDQQPEVDLVAELKHHLATTPKEQLEKEWKELEPWGNIGPTVQEFLYGKQPEVDLEQFDKDVTELWGRCAAEPNDSIACLHIETFIKVARHFWNKGYNARKEK